MIRVLLVCLCLLNGMVQAQSTGFGKVDFRKADSIAALYKGESLKNLAVLAHQLTAPFTSQVQKFRAIYTWVSTNITNDYWAYAKNKRKREKLRDDSLALARWNRSFRTKVFKKLLKRKTTVCTGYAYLIKEMAAMADINCKIINGHGRSVNANIGKAGVPNHSWNAVQLGGKWYLCDATWSSGEFYLQQNSFVPDYNDGYFLADPALFVKNHYPLDTNWLLMSHKPTFTDFLNAPLVYKHAFSYHITPVKPRAMHSQIVKNKSITFLLKAPKTIKTDEISLELIKNENSRKVKPEITRTKEGLLELKYQFKSPGYYDVHLKVAKDYIATYTIKVKRW